MTTTRSHLIHTAAFLALLLVGALSMAAVRAQAPPMSGTTPKLGEQASDFALADLNGVQVRLSEEVERGPIVLVVLRGWPGYQCPFCTRQFGDYMANAATFEASGTRVLFVYPGPGEGLKEHAEAFTSIGPLPAAFRVVLDPDYAFTNSYGLRWSAPEETAYPSTFVVGKGRMVMFARVSRGHGDRVTTADVLKALGR